ncbi:MAG TPA: DNA repair protein RadA [Actinomycetota bacterium]|nr:DNA repair protein RadA [Actinomycetota bacterium]
MARTVRTAYACTECGAASPRWVGRCPSCGSWNSLVEEVLERTAPARASGPVSPPVPITEVAAQTGAHRPTGVEELDRVLGGGLVPGSVVLLAGEPGIGKSTLLLGVLAGLATDGPVLYVCAEESREQVRLRAERLGALHPGLLLAAETDLGTVRALVEQVRPTVVVVDSVQTVADPELAGAPGGVGQVREVAAQLVRLAKERSIATFLVGQVTKEGAVAGPKTLEHLVDVVLNFEGDQHHALRLVRCAKNRFGPAYEVGCFEMTEAGLEPLADPSRLFLSARTAGVSGVACTVSLEGRRPLVTEIQALVVPTGVAVPRRTAQGLDAARLAILVAVLDRRARISLAGNDVFAATAGGVRITEPAADLAVCLALASSARDRQVPPDLITFGEIGLGGEVRPVPQLPRRLAEAARLGFRRALVPATGLPDAARGSADIDLDPVGSVAESLSVLATATPGAPRPPKLGVVPR